MVERIDYQALMRSAPDLYLILSPDLKVLDASGTYLQATMVKREDIIGRYVFDVFPNNPNDPTLRAMESRRRGRVVPGSLRAGCFSAGKI